ncbi:hypothetical protein Q1695_000173 [Nippostrongylus brasiliensis]|nr:hypothetical protein Q1695_000173 [Nippostrongylus brasiliensis]
MESSCRRLAMQERNGFLLCGQGPRLDVFDLSNEENRASIRVLPGEDIHKILNCKGGVVVLGERSVTFVPDSLLFLHRTDDVPSSLYFDDRPLDVAIFEDSQEVAVLFGCYSMARYTYAGPALDLTLVENVRSERYALLMSSILMGDSWSNLVVIAGTMDGEVLVTVPSSGPAVKAKFEGTRGMIFGLELFDGKLFSIADDRCLCVWDAGILESLFTSVSPPRVISKLDGQFGHSARPYSICHDDSGNIYTAGDDEVICVWNVQNDVLKMVYQKDVRMGSIRALRVIGNQLYISCGSGALVSVPVDELIDDFNKRAAGNDDLQVGVRSFARSPLYSSGSVILASVGDKFCHFSSDEGVIWKSCKFGSFILSVAVYDHFAFVYDVERIGTLVNIATRSLVATFHFGELLTLNGIKQHMKITTAVVMPSGENRLSLMLGTVSGHVFFGTFSVGSVGNSVKTSRELNVHFENKPVNQVRSIGDDIYILGSSGVLVLCRHDGHGSLEIVSARTACPHLRGFTPCSFSPHNDYIYGFHARNFHVIDFGSGAKLCTVPCGGIHRQWYFSLLPNYDVLQKSQARVDRAVFEFLRKGSVVSIELRLKPLSVMVPCFHRGQIVGISLLESSPATSIVVTVGADYFVQFSEVCWQKRVWEEKLSLFNGLSPTCIKSALLPHSAGHFVVVGGEKGSLVVWHISPSALVNKKPHYVRSVEYHRDECSARVMDLDIIQISSISYLTVVSFADGKIECLNLNLDEQLGVTIEESKDYEVLSSPNYSIFTKITSWKVNDSVFICAVSTSGMLFLWNNLRRKEPVRTEQMERCGLSALAYLEAEEGSGWLAVGSESGAVTILSVHEATLKKIATLTYHSATVTDVAIRLESSKLLVSSVALDCRFSSFYVDLATMQVTFLRAVPLGVRDPSSLLLTSAGAIAVGNGMELV